MRDKVTMAWCKDQISRHRQHRSIHLSVYVPKHVTIGKSPWICQGVILGAQGFGYIQDDRGEHVHIPHTGTVRIGDYVDIHPYTMIDRATGSNFATIIGDGTKIDRHVHIAHNCRIGNNCQIIAHAQVCGSVVLGNSVNVGASAVIRDHVTVSDNVYIGCGSVVVNDLDRDGWVYCGNPARPLRPREPGEW